MSNGINALKGFDYQATVILDRLFDHFERNGPDARARPEGEDDLDLSWIENAGERGARTPARARDKEPLTVLQIFRSVVDDPVAGCARSAPAPSPPRPGKADISADPELHRPHRPPPNLPTTIPLKRTVDVGHQPQRRPAGRCRSVCLRARWNRRRPRARVWGQRDSTCRWSKMTRSGSEGCIAAVENVDLCGGRGAIRAWRVLV
jgi:hypothetical protein